MGFHSKCLSPVKHWIKRKSDIFIHEHFKEDALVVVPYNPEIAILWRASHNVQKVSKHDFEQYLAKYISKLEPSC